MDNKDPYLDFLRDYEKNDKVLSQLLAIAIHTEREFDRLVNDYCIRPSKIKNLMFAPKMNFLYAVGIIQDWHFQNLALLNALRNHFAHYPDATFKSWTEKDKKNQLRLMADQSQSVDMSKYTDEEILTELHVRVYFELACVETTKPKP